MSNTKYLNPIYLPPDTRSLAELSDAAKFSKLNGGNLANLPEVAKLHQPNEDGVHVFIGNYARPDYEFVYQQYVDVMPLAVTGLGRLLNVTELYQLAAHLAENMELLAEFDTMLIPSFGSIRPRMRDILNHDTHTGGKVLDLSVTCLLVSNGRPSSIYEVSASYRDLSTHFALSYPKWYIDDDLVDTNVQP